MANSIEVSGYVHNVKELKNGLKTFGLSVSTKTGKNKEDQTPEYKSGFINVKTKENVKNEDRVTIKGFITFDFWTPENSTKEKHAMKIYAMEISPFVARENEKVVETVVPEKKPANKAKK